MHDDSITVLNATSLAFHGKTYRCAIGENGFTDTPKEGARKTPTGCFPLREGWFRQDRIIKPETILPLRPIEKSDGWCDAPEHPNYNRPVKLPFAASHEVLWREDHAYDIVVPLGFNDTDIVPGKGSAIFFHIAKPGYSPTLGCVAVSLEDMLEILSGVTLDTVMRIKEKG